METTLQHSSQPPTAQSSLSGDHVGTETTLLQPSVPFSSLVDTLSRRCHQSRDAQCHVTPVFENDRGTTAGYGSLRRRPAAKGLSNPTGENSCFLNSIVQVLWHTPIFRSNFQLLSAHACTERSCIFCALKVLFTQFQFSDYSTIPSSGLRRALAETFAVTGRFQLNLMDDAAECFEKILTGLHWHLVCNQSEDSCSSLHCLTHRKLTMTINEQVFCDCGWSSQARRYNQSVHYVSTSSLTRLSASDGHGASNVNIVRSFAGRLKFGCVNPVQKWRTLGNSPDVVSVGLIWDSDNADQQHIRDVVGLFDVDLDTAEMFDRDVESGNNETVKSTRLTLAAVVCYCRRHYCTLVHQQDTGTWTLFDDANVKQLEAGWTAVVEKICADRYQPLLLIYVNPRPSEPLSLVSAPKRTFFVDSLHNIHRSLGGIIRRKPADYEGGGSANAAETSSHGVARSSADPSIATLASTYQHLSGPYTKMVVSDAKTPSSVRLKIPEWLMTSSDDVSAATRNNHYIRPDVVQSVLGQQGVTCVNYESSAGSVRCTVDSSSSAASVRQRKTVQRRNTISGYVENKKKSDDGTDHVDSACISIGPGFCVAVKGRKNPTEHFSPKKQHANTLLNSLNIMAVRCNKINTVSAEDRLEGDDEELTADKKGLCLSWLTSGRLAPHKAQRASCLKGVSAGTSGVRQKGQKHVSFSEAVVLIPWTDYPNEADIGAAFNYCLERRSSKTTNVNSGATSNKYCSFQTCIPNMNISSSFWSRAKDHVRGDGANGDLVDGGSFVSVNVIGTKENGDESGLGTSDARDTLQRADDSQLLQKNGNERRHIQSSHIDVDAIRCGLCRLRWVVPPVEYCSDCAAYLSRLTPDPPV